MPALNQVPDTNPESPREGEVFQAQAVADREAVRLLGEQISLSIVSDVSSRDPEVVRALNAISRRTQCKVASGEVLLTVPAGSAGLGAYIPGWSDVDVVIVAQSSLTITSLVEQLRGLDREIGNITVSLITNRELERYDFPPKIMFGLMLVGRHLIEPWQVHSGFEPTLLLSGSQFPAGDSELPIVVERCRRYLQADSLKVRAVYKYCVLIARLLMRRLGLDVVQEQELLEVCAEAIEMPELRPSHRARGASLEPWARTAATALSEWYGEL